MRDASLDLAALPDGTHRLALADGRRAFVKVRRDVPEDFFRAEATGLKALSDARALRVPAVIAVNASGIAIEDLGSGRASSRDWEHAGADLAALHGRHGDRFGFYATGYCGDTPQDNTADADGFRFFAKRRLLPQLQRACDAGLLDAADRRGVESICARLRELLPDAAPVLLHGDLWLGNLHACASGELALIDAGAVHHGWAAADLAMLILFGEPPAGFFAAYDSASGGDARWRDHARLLNLYHLLNHLNLFGRGYLVAVRDALRRYT